MQSQLDSVLQRLEACYPDHAVRGLVQRHRQLSEDLTAICKQLGYATREAFLTAYGYRIGAGRGYQRPPVRRWTESAAPPKRETAGAFCRRPESSPEREIPGKIEREPGGPFDRQPVPESPEIPPVQDIRPVPEAPETPEAPPAQDIQSMPEALPDQEFRPMLDALVEKYRDREKPSAFGRLVYENPEYADALWRLKKREYLLGMTLVQYLCETGVLADSPGPRIDFADRLKQKTEDVLRCLEVYYPDHVISRGIERDHKGLSNRITEIYPLLGYESRGAFLEANGYICQFTSGSQGGRPAQDFQPMLDALTEKYRDREKPTAMGALLFENPEYKAQLKTLQNKAQELFGMTLAKYFQSTGILAKKRGRRERPGTPAPAAGQGEDAPIAGLSPAATARLREYYESLNPRFYGTFQDAVRKLEGLEAGCTRRAYSKFYIAGVTACRADVEIPQGIAFIEQGAFQNQTGLETIVLPESLTEIQPSAFEGCTALRRAVLPAGLKIVGNRAFAGCAALEEVDFQGGVPGSAKPPFRVPLTGTPRRRFREETWTAGTIPGHASSEALPSPAIPEARRSWKFPVPSGASWCAALPRALSRAAGA